LTLITGCTILDVEIDKENRMNESRTGTLIPVINKCKECSMGELEDYDDDIQLVTVRDPDGIEKTRRENMCGEHREMNASDGYIVKIVKGK